jgi:heat shock protein HslJ
LKVLYFLSILVLVLGTGSALVDTTEKSIEKIWYVGPEKVPCTGVAPQMCLQIKESPEQNYTLFYSAIEGFCYQPGYVYVIKVREEPVENPPADASSLKWILIEVISKTGNVTASGLEGVDWHLDSYLNPELGNACLLPETEITALFEEDRVSGSAGCNGYSGQYTTEGENITIGGVITTLMFCGEDVSGQESQYLANLEKAAAYNVSGNLLKIYDSNQTLLLTYSVVQPLSLTGTNWQVLSYNNGRQALVSPLAGTNITAVFSEDKGLTGSTGCNNYMTSYEINDSAITISPAATTRMLCSQPEGIMQQESEYLAALESAASFEISDRDLTLFDSNQTRAVVYREIMSD